MGVEPKEEDVPKDPSTFSLEAQQALVLVNALPDKWDGMNGVWLGKDYSGLGDILYIYEVEQIREVFELLRICEVELDKFYTPKAQRTRVLVKG